MSAFDRLLEQLDAFIRKYYLNEVIRGVALFIGVLILSYLLVVGLEYVGRFNSYVRAVLFFGFVVVNGFVLLKYLVQPLLRLQEIGKRMDRMTAAQYIGRFFPEISDRLVNTLQLDDQSQSVNIELLRASVAQRSKSLSVFSFTDAVDFRSNKKYYKQAGVVFGLAIVLAVFIPSLFTEGTKRVVNFSQDFVPEAPFRFVGLQDEYVVMEGEDLELDVELVGTSLPVKTFITFNGADYVMERKGKSSFSYVLPKLSNDLNINIIANGFKSKDCVVKVIPKTFIGKLDASLVYPNYLKKDKEEVSNAFELVIPEGTRVNWSVFVKNSDSNKVISKGFTKQWSEQGFSFTNELREDTRIKLLMFNKEQKKVDSAFIKVSVVKDGFPVINVNEKVDSVRNRLRYFRGRVEDDYGLRSLMFHYTISDDKGVNRKESSVIKVVSGTAEDFDYAIDFSQETLSVGDRIEYWFTVSDNDGVNGSKTTRSSVFSYQVPSLSELVDKRDSDNSKLNKELSNVLNKTQEFKKNVERLKKDVNDSKSSDWKSKSAIDKLKMDQQSIQQQLEKLNKEMKEALNEKEQLNEMDEQLLEKQKLIEELLEELMDDELKELLEKLEELMKNNAKEDVQEQMENLSQTAEEKNKQLDRAMEMLKRLQVNEKIDDIEKLLEELSKKQEELAKEFENGKLDKNELKEKQKKLSEEFEKVKEEMKDMYEKNKELENPLNVSEQKELKNKIDQEQDGAEQKIGSGNRKKAGEEGKSAAEDMQKMADELNQMQEDSNKQQQGEDIESLRRILKNLMELSFDQEAVMKRFASVKDMDPSYKTLGRKQRSIIDDTKQVKDSLEALARRQPKIATFVDKELNEIKQNHSLGLEHIDEHRKRELMASQQLVMTSYNSLALLLNESLQQMQQQMQQMSQSSGSGSCNKPGSKGRPKSGQSMGTQDMKQMLKQQLEQMQKGPNPGGQKPGDAPGQGKEGQGNGMLPGGMSNKQISKMAAEQGLIRERLEQLRNELNKDGQGKGNQLNPLIKELEQQQKDLINKNFSPQMINRQKEILTRLLESEKALMERGFEEKRESKSGKDQNNGNKLEYLEYKKEKLRELESIRSVDPTYRKYYKDKANEYFNTGN